MSGGGVGTAIMHRAGLQQHRAAPMRLPGGDVPREPDGGVHDDDDMAAALVDWMTRDDVEDVDNVSVLSGEEQHFSEDEQDEEDTTEESYRSGRDIQGIPWESLQWSRESYRARRLEQYPNYQNLKEECEAAAGELRDTSLRLQSGTRFYGFHRNFRTVQSTIVHFQLRNLLWATSPHDVYVQHLNRVVHWDLMDQSSTRVLDMSGSIPSGGRAGGGSGSLAAAGKVQVSTLCVRDGLMAAGGFGGELVVKRIDQEGLACSTRVTTSDNGITNGIEVYSPPGGSPPRIATANNDSAVRLYDSGTFKVLRRIDFGFAVNYATVNHHGGRLMAVVGDDPEAYIIDADSGACVARLAGHRDYSFAAAWHPGGHVLATGNQDKTVRLWDIRYLSGSLAVIQGRMGAIRALRYTPDGRYLAAAEPADFVHLYDADSGYARHQEIDVFGEIAGISFTPGGESLFMCVADVTYGSLIQYDLLSQRERGQEY